ncbi:MAG: TATA-box-binding protein [Methanocorpusculum sp.]|mgnify:CR=1 FL=1|jgi:transcription initiation factor TFIID TATA-box-binding protein|nr:TATA-box-binding protein [Methanocorpusculum sp.]MDD3257786.1 TATA-box-binding protein [Methanocorpusculum sp.]MDD4132356.1 TATA-box-binding protein [Methanocorpusculum sp.]
MEGKTYASLKIENIVASGVIADEIDLAEISEKIDGCELNTKRFPGAVYRIDNPKMASLIFSSGKVVLTGIRNQEGLEEGLAKVLVSLKAAGVKILDVPRVAVTNIVCSYDIGRFINLNRVIATLSLEAIEYEPEQFPGLVYRVQDPKIVALLFSSGKIILTGGKTIEDVKKGLDFLEDKLKDVLSDQKPERK